MVKTIIFLNLTRPIMNQTKLFIVLIFNLTIGATIAYGQDEPIDRNALDEFILNRMIETQKVFQWNDLNDKQLHAALIMSDSIAVVGYQPESFNSIRTKMHQLDLKNDDWKNARNKLIDFVVDETNKLQDKSYSSKDLLYFPSNDKLPYFFIKISDLAIVQQLRTFPELRYLQSPAYTIIPSEQRSGEGCDDYSTSLDPADYTAITPAAVQPWNHYDHQIDCAWTNSNQGEDIWIAVMDTGVSETNPKFNDDFDEGDSGGRVIEKYGFYQNDGWEDGCGHGSAMAGLALAPRGFDDYPVGVAYRSNLISYRVTNDVRINSTDEINGLGDALIDAGDDERIHIISISLGDVFSSGPVEDGIIYAHNLGKLIFAAAGTSTTFTNWYGVIFPANMPEAIAITGVVENSNFNSCDICHEGNEVEFVVYMERASSGNNAPTITNDNVNGEYYGYVGGSSAATATMAGMAALVWGNNPTFDKNQLINRLIQTSSNYPNKDSDYGWGAVNACDAVDSTFNIPCSSSISNEVMMEITSITFPSTGDTGGDAEWVLEFEGDSYYFNVPVGGATGNPSNFIDLSICGSVIPMTIDLGVTTCGDATVMMDMQSYEDDSFTSNCTFNTGFNSDDDLTVETIDVDLGLNSFVHNSTAGTFTIEYILYCTPTLIAGVNDDSPVCYGADINFEASPVGQTNYEFFQDLNLNGDVDLGESLQSGPSHLFTTGSLTDADVIGVVVTDSNACSDISTTTVYVSAIDYASANKLTGLEDGFADYETDGVIESCQTIGSNAVVDYDSQVEINLEIGFETINGSEIFIFIDGCDNGGGGINLTEEGDEKKD